jgi:peptidyl-prolyl cis-trans isomerase B (cyclophilin B)
METKKNSLKLFTIAAIISIITFTGCTTQGTTAGENTSNSDENTMVDTSKVNKYSAVPATLSADELKGKVAVIKTDKGDISVELYGDIAPQTVSNFIFLANEKFYDGLVFHRREEGFVIQGGDPLGDGSGGPGYTVPAEISPKAKHILGALAMARRPDFVNPEKESSGSQFYITLAETDFLDGEYTVFGKVTDGMDIAERIQIGDQILGVEIK